MAAAEARAAWQRAANRYIVQEDAKRAPKLACSQSSSTSRCKQPDIGPPSAVDGSDNPGFGFMSFNMNHLHFNLPPEAQWWIQLDHNYDLQKGYNCGEMKPGKADAETVGVEDMKSAPMDGRSNSKTLDEHVGLSHIVNGDVSKEHGQVAVEELSATKCKEQDVLDIKDLTDYYDLMEMESAGESASKPLSDLSFHDTTWIEGEKVPWWRKSDKYDLASFVAQKSLQIENCDLPLTHKMHVRRKMSDQPAGFDPDEMFVSLEEWGETNVTSSLYSQSSPDAASKRRERASVDKGPSGSAESGWMSVDYNDMIDKSKHSGEDPDRAQLLEALCHSQTRAREAEKAAKQAYTEKEHIVKLFFKQASQLFAYKQWFRLLQMESYMHNSANQPPSYSTPFPDVLAPWSPYKPHRVCKKTSKAKRRKWGLPRCDICKYAVAFALGLSLVGAGLLLGWTVGWLFPTF